MSIAARYWVTGTLDIWKGESEVQEADEVLL